MAWDGMGCLMEEDWMKGSGYWRHMAWLISGGDAGRYEPGHEKVGRIRWECVEGRPCRLVRKGFMAVSY